MHRILWLLLAVGCVVSAGCNPGKEVVVATVQAEGHSGHDHDHERDKMMLVDVGRSYHAGLTAHLSSKEGNELDIFIEAVRDAKPVAISMKKITASVKRAGDAKEYTLEFLPAEMKERPKDEWADGPCSHFVAKAPWMKADDKLTITANITINGNERTAEWADFNPGKYAHHVD